MTKYSISKAAIVAGKSRVTIQRHIKNGKLSCTFDTNGNKFIDVSELIRAYGEINIDDTGKKQLHKNKMMHHDTGENDTEIRVLQEQVKFLKEQLGEEKARTVELKEEKVRLLGIVEKQTNLLEYQQQKKKSFWKVF